MYKIGCDSCDSCDNPWKSFYNDVFQIDICHNCRFFELWHLWHLLLVHQICDVEHKNLPWDKSLYNIDNDAIQNFCAAGLRLRILKTLQFSFHIQENQKKIKKVG
jgi:hypothetical protein